MWRRGVGGRCAASGTRSSGAAGAARGRRRPSALNQAYRRQAGTEASGARMLYTAISRRHPGPDSDRMDRGVLPTSSRSSSVGRAAADFSNSVHEARVTIQPLQEPMDCCVLLVGGAVMKALARVQAHERSVVGQHGRVLRRQRIDQTPGARAALLRQRSPKQSRAAQTARGRRTARRKRSTAAAAWPRSSSAHCRIWLW